MIGLGLPSGAIPGTEPEAALLASERRRERRRERATLARVLQPMCDRATLSGATRCHPVRAKRRNQRKYAGFDAVRCEAVRGLACFESRGSPVRIWPSR